METIYLTIIVNEDYHFKSSKMLHATPQKETAVEERPSTAGKSEKTVVI